MSVPSPAALILLQHNITGAQLARTLGVTRQAVSLQLAGGTAETSTALLQAIADAGGPELAEKVARSIDTLRETKAAT